MKTISNFQNTPVFISNILKTKTQTQYTVPATQNNHSDLALDNNKRKLITSVQESNSKGTKKIKYRSADQAECSLCPVKFKSRGDKQPHLIDKHLKRAEIRLERLEPSLVNRLNAKYAERVKVKRIADDVKNYRRVSMRNRSQRILK